MKMANCRAQQTRDDIQTKHPESTCELTVANGKLSNFMKFLHDFKKMAKGKPFQFPMDNRWLQIDIIVVSQYTLTLFSNVDFQYQ